MPTQDTADLLHLLRRSRAYIEEYVQSCEGNCAGPSENEGKTLVCDILAQLDDPWLPRGFAVPRTPTLIGLGFPKEGK